MYVISITNARRIRRIKMDKREQIINALENKSDDEINEEFEYLIRNQLTDKQFWKWVISWKDAEDICDRAGDWNIDTKRKEIDIIKKMFKLK